MAGTCRAPRLTMSQWADRWEILRKYYLALPFRMLRNLSRRLRDKITADPRA